METSVVTTHPGRIKSPTSPYHKQVREFQVKLITETLISGRGNRSHAARVLGLQRTYLIKLIREYKIDVPARPRRNGSE